MIEIVSADTPEQIAAAQALFREYQSWLGLSLCFQNFDEEVENLPGKYAPVNYGKLLLAYDGNKLAGCVAVRKSADKICEMKRLFVRANFRGKRIGNRLIEKIIDEARAIGYKKMRLDTFPPKMGKAVALYELYDFYEIAPYYHNPFGETLYLEKIL